MEILVVRNNHTIINWNSRARAKVFANYDLMMNDIKTEKLASKLTKNNKMKKFVITLLGLALYCKNVFAATKGIDALGWTLLSLVRHWAYWILLIWCIVDVIKSGLSGDSKKTLPIVLKYVVIFASMYLIPAIFDAIKKSF